MNANNSANPFGLSGLGNLGQWGLPTVDLEELEKRIQELKAVHFWLDQNTKALSASIQALEVQKMTLSTLQGMNVSLSEVAKAFRFGSEAGESSAPASAPAAAPAAPEAAAAAAGAAADPMVWWGNLSQQFQHIAAQAMASAAPVAGEQQPSPTAATTTEATLVADSTAAPSVSAPAPRPRPAPVKAPAAKRSAAKAKAKASSAPAGRAPSTPSLNPVDWQLPSALFQLPSMLLPGAVPGAQSTPHSKARAAPPNGSTKSATSSKSTLSPQRKPSATGAKTAPRKAR